ncbi:MAG TPA: aldose epimerase family protein [Parafilimonas sp.]|jgi:aldose 1-epimerase|nr:aldose epimerase family protein [Parafilimonas sp.]
MHKNKVYILSFLIIAFTACNNSNQMNNENSDSTKTDSSTSTGLIPEAKNFQTTIDGKQTNLYVLKNGNMQVAITNYGARIVSIIVPDKNGNPTDVAVGYDAVQPYGEGGDTYFGAIVGRYGNRIAKGKFKLDGKEYTLATNNGANHLHGGNKGFSREVWDAQQQNDSTLVLTYLSKDGEEGYPGNLNAKVTYTVLSNDQLKIDYEATTDKNTVLNLTNHTYFNLNGQGNGTITNHSVMINASTYTPVDSTLIPTGKFESVKGTPFDFTTPTAIGARVNDSSNQQIKFGHGYDHNFVLNTKGNIDAKAAEVTGDESGIVMDVYTLQPGLQFYVGNFMNGSHTIKNGKKDDYRTAFCMETQHYPDSPNQPNFPSTELKPGQQYKTSTIYAFSVKK